MQDCIPYIHTSLPAHPEEGGCEVLATLIGIIILVPFQKQYQTQERSRTPGLTCMDCLSRVMPRWASHRRTLFCRLFITYIVSYFAPCKMRSRGQHKIFKVFCACHVKCQTLGTVRNSSAFVVRLSCNDAVFRTSLAERETDIHMDNR